MRELPDFADPSTTRTRHINTAADIQRAGFKVMSGYFSAAAGALTAVVDFIGIYGQMKRKEPDFILIAIYLGRGLSGAYTAYGAIKIGFTYTQGAIASQLKNKGLQKTAEYAVAQQLSQRVGLLLHFSRFNMIGTAFTIVELLYLWLKDDDLQKWCKKCTFRKEKIAESALTKYSFSVMRATYATESFPTLDEELEALTQAFAEVTGQKPEETPPTMTRLAWTKAGGRIPTVDVQPSSIIISLTMRHPS